MTMNAMEVANTTPKGGQFWPDLNSLDWRMSVLAYLEWLGMSKVDFGLSGMAWNRGSCF
jgi:hypothetical protein